MQRIVVLFPEPFGPRKPVTWPGLDREAERVDGDLAAEPLGQTVDRDHERRRSCAVERAVQPTSTARYASATSVGDCLSTSILTISDLRMSVVSFALT